MRLSFKTLFIVAPALALSACGSADNSKTAPASPEGALQQATSKPFQEKIICAVTQVNSYSMPDSKPEDTHISTHYSTYKLTRTGTTSEDGRLRKYTAKGEHSRLTWSGSKLSSKGEYTYETEVSIEKTELEKNTFKEMINATIKKTGKNGYEFRQKDGTTSPSVTETSKSEHVYKMEGINKISISMKVNDEEISADELKLYSETVEQFGNLRIERSEIVAPRVTTDENGTIKDLLDTEICTIETVQ